MKFAQISGCLLAVALVMSSSTPSYARGGGHGGGHGGHGGGHAHSHAHAHAFAHHAAAGHAHAFAHHGGFAGHHFAANHAFAHNHAGWNHGWGWGHGLGWGWGRGGWRSGYWGSRFAGGWGPAYFAAGLVNPSYYCQYLNGATNSAVPTPVTPTQYDITNVVPPATAATTPVDVIATPSGQETDLSPAVAK